MSESSAPSSTSPQQIIVQTSSTSDENSSFFNGTGKQGTYLSFILLLLSIVASIILQRYAPDNIDLSSWDKGCSVDYLTDCKANSAVLRISFALSILFALQAIGSILYTKFYDWFWSPKYAVFFCICVGFYFADSSVFNLDGYAWAARVTGFLYLIILQIILIDGAYTWNEQWVAFSVEEGEEKGQKWLIGIVVISCIIFIVSIGCIVLMFIQFTNGGSHSNCVDSKIILSLTIALPAIATITQLFFTEEGSILTSAIITGYATYVCYSAVSLNPDTNCNPSLDSGYQKISVVSCYRSSNSIIIILPACHLQYLSHIIYNLLPPSYVQVIGLVLLVVSITWATFNAGRYHSSITSSKFILIASLLLFLFTNTHTHTH
jgi:hypothetical protein